MPTFKNYNEFEKFFNSKLQQAMELTWDEVFKILSNKVDEYYNETPIGGWGSPQYENTDMLKNAKEKTSVSKIGDKLMFTVGFSDEYLTYEYPGWKVRFGRGTHGKMVLQVKKFFLNNLMLICMVILTLWEAMTIGMNF